MASSLVGDNSGAQNKIENCNYPTIFFHSIAENAVTWKIFGGEIFIDAVPNENAKKPFDVYYLTNDMWNDAEAL